MSQRAIRTSSQQSRSIEEAGREFVGRLIQHFENDRPDVREQEAEEER